MPFRLLIHRFLLRSGLLLLLGLHVVALTVIAAEETSPNSRADGSLAILMAGNARFVNCRLRHPDQSESRRKEISSKQEPFAIILTCSDSRVPPEIYFDQGLGDLFVIRNAGNVLDGHVIGSMEYAVEHLHVPLILVIGHEHCGAVSAAVAGGHLPGRIPEIIASIAPAVAASKGQEGDPVDNAVMMHAQLSAVTLRASNPILSAAVSAGELEILAARYDLDTGKVLILPELPQEETPPSKPTSKSAHSASVPPHTPEATHEATHGH
jgi:carbonic anhydrase